MKHVTHSLSMRVKSIFYNKQNTVFVHLSNLIVGFLFMIKTKVMADFHCSQANIYAEEARCVFCKNKVVISTAIAPLEGRMNTRLGYYLPAKDANTQTTKEDFILLKTTQEASTQTNEEDFMLLEATREACTQTREEDFIFLEPTQDAGTRTIDEDFILLKPNQDAIVQTVNKDPVLFEPMRDSSAQLAKEDLILVEPTQNTNTQTTDKDFILLEPRTQASVGFFSSFKVSENNFSKMSADSQDGILITWHRYKNGFCIGNINLSNFSSCREVPAVKNASRKQPILNDMQIAKKVPELNRMKNVPYHRKIIVNAPAVKRSRNKIRRTNNPVALTKNVQGDARYVCPKVSQMPFNFNFPVGISQKSLNAQNKGEIKSISNLTGNRLLTISHFDKAASNKKLSQTYQNKYTPSEISDSKRSAEGMYSDIDASKIKGLSCFYKSKNNSNMPEKKFQPGLSLGLKLASSERKKWLVCAICNTVYAEQDFGKDFHKCYLCRYLSYRNRGLQLDTCIQGSEPFSCKTCGEGFTKKDLHDAEQTCNFCFEVFQCKGLLEKHSLVHKSYDLSHCQVCKWKISAHIIEYKGKRQYQCCGCSYRTNHTKYLLLHVITHVGLQVFRCYVCESSFSEKKSLEKHFRNEHDHSSTNVDPYIFSSYKAQSECRLLKHSQD